MRPGTRKPEQMIDNCEVGRGKSKGKRIELQYLKSSSGSHLCERKRAGHVNQKTSLKILCLFCVCYEEETSQEMRMLSRSLSDCQSTILIAVSVVIVVSVY